MKPQVYYPTSTARSLDTPRLLKTLGVVVLVAGCLSACAGPRIAALPPPPAVEPSQTAPPEEQPNYDRAAVPGFSQTGLASWYGKGFSRKHTASGERFDMEDLTAAHRSLPLGTVVRVTNLTNGRTLLLRVNDRGPFTQGRVLDVSRSAADLLDMKKDGVVPVRIEVFAEDQREKIAENIIGTGTSQ